MNFQTVDFNDKAKWYEIRRNELLELLRQTSSLEITPDYRKTLSDIHKKCLENQFEIVLVSEFQGGKSTTFNALCDGRDLSPRGLNGGGIKTSAAIISAQNISDGETKDGMTEWAEITFKTKQDMAKIMFDILHEELLGNAEFKRHVMQKNSIDDGAFYACMLNSDKFANTLDMDDCIHQKAIREALNAWWAQWKSDRASIDGDTLDSLRIATLLMRFYGTGKYKQLVQKTVVGIYDFQKMIAFPSDWVIRWQDGENAEFTLEDAAFVFIGRTLLRIKSKNLEAIGCRITDCPGLCANAYDTKVAQEAIVFSDGIWYLIGGDKQIGQKDLDSIKFIADMGLTEKITGSVNLIGKHSQKLVQIFPITKEILKQAGYTFPVLHYNARLAFLGQQGERIQSGCQLSDYELQCMKMDSEHNEPNNNTSPAEMWSGMVQDSGVITGLKDLKMVDALVPEAVRTVKQASNIDEITTFLNKGIVSKKARSILVENGSEKAAAALMKYEGVLQTSEDAAIMKEQEFDEQARNAGEALTRFIRKSHDMIQKSFSEAYIVPRSEYIAAEFGKLAFKESDFIRDFSFSMASAIIKYRGKLFWTDKGYKQAVLDEFAPELDAILKRTFLKIVNTYLVPRIDCPTWNEYVSLIEKTGDEIKDLWNREYSFIPQLNGIVLDIPKGAVFETCIKKIQVTVLNNEGISNIILEWHSLWSSIAGMGETVLGGVIELFNWITKHKFESGAEKKKKELQDKIHKFGVEKIQPKLKWEIQNEFSIREMSKPLASIFENIQRETLRVIIKSLDGLESELYDRTEKARLEFKKSEAERIAVAETNHKIRVEQIEPLRKEIQAFEKLVTAELSKQE